MSKAKPIDYTEMLSKVAIVFAAAVAAFFTAKELSDAIDKIIDEKPTTEGGDTHG